MWDTALTPTSSAQGLRGDGDVLRETSRLTEPGVSAEARARVMGTLGWVVAGPGSPGPRARMCEGASGGPADAEP